MSREVRHTRKLGVAETPDIAAALARVALYEARVVRPLGTNDEPVDCPMFAYDIPQPENIHAGGVFDLQDVPCFAAVRGDPFQRQSRFRRTAEFVVCKVALNYVAVASKLRRHLTLYNGDIKCPHDEDNPDVALLKQLLIGPRSALHHSLFAPRRLGVHVNQPRHFRYFVAAFRIVQHYFRVRLGRVLRRPLLIDQLLLRVHELHETSDVERQLEVQVAAGAAEWVHGDDHVARKRVVHRAHARRLVVPEVRRSDVEDEVDAHGRGDELL